MPMGDGIVVGSLSQLHLQAERKALTVAHLQTTLKEKAALPYTIPFSKRDEVVSAQMRFRHLLVVVDL